MMKEFRELLTVNSTRIHISIKFIIQDQIYGKQLFVSKKTTKFLIYLISRGGSGVVSRSALLKGGYGTRQGGKQLARSSRCSSVGVSIKAQG